MSTRKHKYFLRTKILINDHIFYTNYNSEIYYLFIKHFNNDIWENIFKFLYPQKKQILKWKKNHIMQSYIYISIFKYLYRNSNKFKSKKNKYIINFLKRKYNYLITVRDLYYLQFKIYQTNIDTQNFIFENNTIKYKSSSNS